MDFQTVTHTVRRTNVVHFIGSQRPYVCLVERSEIAITQPGQTFYHIRQALLSILRFS
jgi:hypothetical protein